jgi:hypothetical protein
MAGQFKPIGPNDRTTTRTLLHEAIPLTGAIVSGTYGTENIKNFSHGMFQSVYDYPFLSSSANHIFDISVGFSPQSALSASSNIQNQKKINIYNEMAQILMGYDKTGSIQQFDEDGNLALGGTKMQECFFLNFSRLLVKDEIKKGTFTLKLGVNSDFTGALNYRHINVYDKDANSQFLINSPAGEYGVLYATNSLGPATEGALEDSDMLRKVGLLYYQAGIAVISASVFGAGGAENVEGALSASALMIRGNDSLDATVDHVLTGSEISGACDNFRHRIVNLEFQNTTEINSTIYYCRVNHGDFNYSSNPTYTSGSKIVVKNDSTDMPVSYITAVGLYAADNELMAVAKLSEPLRKDPATEFTIRVRLDY